MRPGTFVAAVGADNENQQEIDPALLANSKVVTDITEQYCAIGDLHHALVAGAMSRAGVHAELGEIVAGLKPARTNAEEIIVFDSTGTALQDVAAAVAVYGQVLKHGDGSPFHLIRDREERTKTMVQFDRHSIPLQRMPALARNVVATSQPVAAHPSFPC